MKLSWSWWYVLLLLALVWRAIYAFWVPLVNKFLVPPGDDPAAHIRLVADLLAGQWKILADGYPLGFHNVIALAAKLTGWDALTATRLIAPLLLVLPVIVLYIVGSRLFKSKTAGTFAALVWAFLALAPIRAFGDGNYPNMLGGGVLVPLALLALWQYGQKPDLKNMVWVLISFFAIALTHHLSLIYVMAAALPFFLWAGFVMVRASIRKSVFWPIVLGFFVLVGLAALLWNIYGPTLIAPYIETFRTLGSLASIFGTQSVPLTWTQLLELHNPLFVALGIAGTFLLLVAKVSPSTKILLSGWVIMLWLLSTTSIFGLPERFSRELAIPLALTGGFFLSYFIDQAKARSTQALLLTMAVALIYFEWQASFNRPFALPDPYTPLIRVQHEEESAIQTLIAAIPPGTTVLANNSNPYLPFMVNERVIVLEHPEQMYGYLAQEPVSILFIGSRPPLTPEEIYPFYYRFDAIRAVMDAIPNKERVEALRSGTEIYRIIED